MTERKEIDVNDFETPTGENTDVETLKRRIETLEFQQRINKPFILLMNFFICMIIYQLFGGKP